MKSDPDKIYIVRGNHDFSTRPRYIAGLIAELGAHLLDGRPVYWEKNGAQICIAGLEAPYSPGDPAAVILDKLPEAGFRILLTHTPDNFPLAARKGWDWVLAGHTHGGQSRLPWIGPILVPSVHGRRFAYGIHRIDQSILTVTAGIGAQMPFRLFTPPEMVVYTLHRKPQSGD